MQPVGTEIDITQFGAILQCVVKLNMYLFFDTEIVL